VLGSCPTDRSFRWLLSAVCACWVVVVVGACGGTGSTSHSTAVSTTTATGTQSTAGAQAPSVPPPPRVRLAAGVIARVGGHTITPALLNQWMQYQVGEGYFLAGRRQAPTGLVHEPANYPACVAALEKLGPPPAETPTSLRTRCSRLYQTIRKATLAFLISSYWASDFAAAHGVTITSAELKAELQRYRAAQYPKPGEFERVLA
jgi:hypothetical protein